MAMKPEQLAAALEKDYSHGLSAPPEHPLKLERWQQAAQMLRELDRMAAESEAVEASQKQEIERLRAALQRINSYTIPSEENLLAGIIELRETAREALGDE